MPDLTAHETLVLASFSQGLTAKEVGEMLHKSHRTVKTQLGDIMRKLGARNCVHAVAIGLREGIIQ